MWKYKQHTLKYFSIGLASSIGSYLGLKYHVSKREINAEDVLHKEENKVIGKLIIVKLQRMFIKILSHHNSNSHLNLFSEFCNYHWCGSHGTWHGISSCSKRF